MTQPLGIAVIGAGMAGKAHMNAYRNAAAIYGSTLPPLRLISVGDVNETFGKAAADRYGFERCDTDWRTIANDPDIHIVSVVIANAYHREVVAGLLAAGKNVLCEKPLSDTLEDAQAMVDAANSATGLARIGFTYRRSPGIAFIRDLVNSGKLGKVLHFDGHYWADYGCDPKAPISWRYQGPNGSGALADVGSHLTYIAEFICGDIISVSGGTLATTITTRPKPLGHVAGHGNISVSDELAPVENDDYAAFSVKFSDGAGALQVSRVAAGYPNGLRIEVFCENGSAIYDQHTPAEVQLMLRDDDATTNGYRRVMLGAQHPYLAAGAPIDVAGVGFGQNEGFQYQARAFIEEVLGLDNALPPCATFEEGLRNMQLLQAVVDSANGQGIAVTVPTKADPQ